MVKKINEHYGWLFDNNSNAWKDSNIYLDALEDFESKASGVAASINAMSREFHFGENVEITDIEDATKFLISIIKQIDNYYDRNNLGKYSP